MEYFNKRNNLNEAVLDVDGPSALPLNFNNFWRKLDAMITLMAH